MVFLSLGLRASLRALNPIKLQYQEGRPSAYPHLHSSFLASLTSGGVRTASVSHSFQKCAKHTTNKESRLTLSSHQIHNIYHSLHIFLSLLSIYPSIHHIFYRTHHSSTNTMSKSSKITKPTNLSQTSKQAALSSRINTLDAAYALCTLSREAHEKGLTAAKLDAQVAKQRMEMQMDGNGSSKTAEGQAK